MGGSERDGDICRSGILFVHGGERGERSVLGGSSTSLGVKQPGLINYKRPLGEKSFVST